MVRLRGVTLLVTLALGASVVAACSSSKKTTTSATTSPAGGLTVTTAAGAAGHTVDVTLGDTKGTDGPMTMEVTPATTSAGDVTFVVKNNGTVDHEMIVLKTDLAFDKLPVVDAGDPPVSVASGADKVDEAGNIGETGDPNLKKGDTRTFTVKGMTAGKYVLVCNIAKHYGLGMRAAFTVS